MVANDIEFLAIFLGVTLSLMADDWRSSREDRDQEATILSALVSNFSMQSIRNLNGYGTGCGSGISRGRVSMQADRLRTPCRSVDEYFRPMFFYRTDTDLSPTAYVNLREGGRLPLIDDAELRSAITAYYEIEQDYMIQFYEIVQETCFLWRRVAFRHVQIVPAELPGSFFPPDRFDYRTSWDAFRRDPEAAALLRILAWPAGTSRCGSGVRGGESGPAGAAG